MAEVKDKLVTVESVKVIHDSLNDKLTDVVYAEDYDSEATSVPLNADTLGGRPASEYATNAKVDALTAEEVGARPDTWMPSASDVGAAPAGYGLGTIAVEKSWSEIDSLMVNGWYRIPNINSTINNVSVVSALVRVDWYYGDYGVQTLYAVNTASGSHDMPILQRTRGYGAWGAWECVNPPMAMGVEYRTTERSDGEPVYAKRFNYTTPSGGIGNSSDVTDVSIPHGISNFDSFVRCDAKVGNYALPSLERNGGGITSIHTIDATNVTIRLRACTWGGTFWFDLYYKKNA